jgi:hypothetical protein
MLEAKAIVAATVRPTPTAIFVSFDFILFPFDVLKKTGRNRISTQSGGVQTSSLRIGKETAIKSRKGWEANW